LLFLPALVGPLDKPCALLPCGSSVARLGGVLLTQLAPWTLGDCFGLQPCHKVTDKY